MTLADEPAEKINYRSCGRGDGGVLKAFRSRRIRARSSTPTPSTIPAKFETVLYKGNREPKGFGSIATRFPARDPGEGVPGPGTHEDCNAESTESAAGSRSKRGSSAFASRSARVPKASFRAPGPGTYATQAPSSPSGSQAENPSSAFVIPGTVNPAKFNAHPSPGPGHYKPVTDHPKINGPGGTVANVAWHRPANGHSILSPKHELPGPGHYEDKTLALDNAPAPVWHSGGRRRLMQTEASFHEMSVSEQIKMGEKTLSEGTYTRDTAQHKSGNGPAPGQYEPNVDAVMGHTDFGTMGSRVFQKGLSHLPRSWRPLLPGPGDYDPQAPEISGVTQSMLGASAFASASPRMDRKKPGAPGPAYYTPRLPEQQKSFHLNIKDSWM